MQVKKFEAPSLQEALEVVKRELGPEAIILQTKQNKKGFGLMSKGSVEVTAAVSERQLTKKGMAEKKLPIQQKEALLKSSAKAQAHVYDRTEARHLDMAMGSTSDRVAIGGKSITRQRYADIDDDTPSAKPGAYDRIKSRVQSAARSASDATPKMAQPQARQAIPVQTFAQQQQQAVRTQAAQSTGVEASEVAELRRMIQDLKRAQDEAVVKGSSASRATLGSDALNQAFEQLVLAGVDRRYALPLIKKAGFELGERASEDMDSVLDQVAMELMRTTEVVNGLEGIQPRTKVADSEGLTGGPVIVALVGPTGVGKTTTLAKIAAQALLKKSLKVGLINLDSYKVAAFDQLATYAKILGVPFRSASSNDDLEVALKDFKSLDLILIDTTGRSPRDSESLDDLEKLLHSIPGVNTQLVVSSLTRDLELYDLANRFSVFRPQGLIVSKLDEAQVFGSVFNISQKTKLPLIYFATGQRVPEDIEDATPERLAALILDL
jgi:flagellar biosynthesis protein FlhF